MITVFYKTYLNSQLHPVTHASLDIWDEYSTFEELEADLVNNAKNIVFRKDIEYFMGVCAETGKTKRYSIEAQYTLHGW